MNASLATSTRGASPLAVRARRAAAALALLALAAPAAAKNGPGVTDTEIKIGNTAPYSGNASAYGTNTRAMGAYLQMINDQGGVNGRKVNFITLDDGYSPPKTVELTRQLVERDQVLLMFGSIGTAPNVAVHKYLNQKKVPQLFPDTGSSKWNDPKNFPWTMGLMPDYHTEGLIYAKHILQTVKDPKIAVLRQNDDLGLDYLDGFKEGLGKDADRLLAKVVTYEVTDPTVDSQVIELKNTGANVFFIITTPKFGAQTLKKAGEIGWHPAKYIVSVSASIGAAIKPGGFENAQGAISAQFLKDATDPRWADEPDFKAWKAWMAKYNPTGNPAELGWSTGYAFGAALVQVLKQCGDDLSRENVMKQAQNLHGIELPMVMPGITVDTGPNDYAPMQAERLTRFEGENWVLVGDVISAE